MIVLNFINSPNESPEPIEKKYTDLIDERGIHTVDGAFIEFKAVYQERIPFSEIPMLDGPCYRWTDDFINNCLLAMATDRMIQFSTDELEAWRYFVNFENYHSTSALETSANGTAIGCTNPNSSNKSFVVAGDGTILNGLDGNPEELCKPPGYETEGEQVWKSLDSAFIALYNCREINTCSNTHTMYDVSTCAP